MSWPQRWQMLNSRRVEMGESCFHSFLAWWSALFNHFCTLSLCPCTRSTRPGTNWWDTLRLHYIALSRWSYHVHWDRKVVAMNPKMPLGSTACETLRNNVKIFSIFQLRTRKGANPVCCMRGGKNWKQRYNTFGDGSILWIWKSERAWTWLKFILPRTENDW